MASPCDNHILISTSNRISFTLFFTLGQMNISFLLFGFWAQPNPAVNWARAALPKRTKQAKKLVPERDSVPV